MVPRSGAIAFAKGILPHQHPNLAIAEDGLQGDRQGPGHLAFWWLSAIGQGVLRGHTILSYQLAAVQPQLIDGAFSLKQQLNIGVLLDH